MGVIQLTARVLMVRTCSNAVAGGTLPIAARNHDSACMYCMHTFIIIIPSLPHSLCTCMHAQNNCLTSYSHVITVYSYKHSTTLDYLCVIYVHLQLQNSGNKRGYISTRPTSHHLLLVLVTVRLLHCWRGPNACICHA